MNIFVAYILVFVGIVVAIGSYFIIRPHIGNNATQKFFVQKGRRLYFLIAIVPIVAFILWYLGGGLAISKINGFDYSNRFRNFFGIATIWASIFCFLVSSFQLFYDFRLLRLVGQWVALPLSIVCIALLSNGMFGIVGLQGENDQWLWRLYPYTLSLGLTFGFLIVSIVRHGWVLPQKQDVKYAYLPFVMFAASIPTVFFQVISGKVSSISVSGFDFWHRIFLYAAILIPILTFLLLYNKDHRTKKAVLLYMSFAALITFSVRVNFGSRIEDLPFQICNTALYLTPLCLLFKLKYVFYFTYFINTIGALLAMAVPGYDLTYGLTDASLWHYMLGHFSAFYMPILMMALRVNGYERAKIKHFGFAMGAFTVYFALILVINAGLQPYADSTLNFFFTNTSFLPFKFGAFGRNIYKMVVEFQIGSIKFILHPIWLVVYFSFYVAFSLLLWLILTQINHYVVSIETTLLDRQVKQKGYYAFVEQRALAGNPVVVPKSFGFRKVDPSIKSFVVVSGSTAGGAVANPISKISLELKDMSKKYGRGKSYAVQNANLVINGGEIFGFLGPNGAGKSTIIKSIVGMQNPTSGNIEICGYDTVYQDINAKLCTGYVPDHYALYEKLTGREYINYIADIYRVSKADRDQWINELVTRFELSHKFDSPIQTYSHGMKQKIAIIAAIVHKPKLWILDEPLTGLDPTSIYQVKETMREYAQQGNIVFFSSHIIDVVEDLCQRISIIKKGQIQGIWNIEEIQGQVENKYLEVIGITKSDYAKQLINRQKTTAEVALDHSIAPPNHPLPQDNDDTTQSNPSLDSNHNGGSV